MAERGRSPLWRRMLSWVLVIALPLAVFSCWNATRPYEGGPVRVDARP